MATRRALITGVSGFVGGRLARRLLEDGWNVAAVVRQKSGIPEGFQRLSAYRHDGSTRDLVRIVGAAKPHVVFHLASLYLATHAPADVEPLVRSNVLFGAQLAEAMAARRIPYLVNTGTAWQHYENKAYCPVNLYAATKQAFEDILLYYAEANQLRIITLKLSDTYGPGDLRPKLFSLLRRSAAEELKMSAGRQRLDLVHIDDVIEAFVLSARRLMRGKVKKPETYAVSSGRPARLRAIAGLFEEIIGRRLQINWGARPYRDREVFNPWSKGRRLPGWRPRIGLVDGMRQLLTESRVRAD